MQHTYFLVIKTLEGEFCRAVAYNLNGVLNIIKMID